ncbi:MAG: hypothetical protein WA323_06455 [Candidatus Nitrosopolaris sp.]
MSHTYTLKLLQLEITTFGRLPFSAKIAANRVKVKVKPTRIIRR